MKIRRGGLRSAFLFLAAWLAFGATASIETKLYLDEIKFLASPEMRGRATGSPQLEKAADFIAAKFRSFGLKPAGDGSYLQAFPVTTNGKLGAGNRFSFSSPGRALSMPASGGDFMPFPFSASAHVTGQVVFVGYGITAPEYHYDDYQGIDVKGKFVLLLRHEPQENDEQSVFAGKTLTQYAQFAYKATNARTHGAAGVILVNDVLAHAGEDDLPKFGNVDGPAESGIPFLQVKEKVVDPWFTDNGKHLEQIEADIDQNLKPESFAFPSTLRVDATVDIQREVKTVHNVAAYLPGQTGEYIVIGAHYDHLGLGERYSMAPDQAGTIHPGADDNASGTAGVIELARWFSRQPKQKRGILFLSFAGEEMALSSTWSTRRSRCPMRWR
jgi:aminopeptidase YwaD